MSEFSESLHFRHPIPIDDAALRDVLVASKLYGVLLPPSNGWRTFVPFKSAPLKAEWERYNGARLSVVVGVPVVEYHYAEDYYWCFFVWVNADCMTVYSCGFLEDVPLTEGEIEPVLLSTLLPDGVSIDELQAMLMKPALTQDEGRDEAKQFVRLLGLSNTEYTGPQYIRDEVERLREVAGCMVIEKPRATRRPRRKEG